MTVIPEFFQWLNSRYGLNFSVFYDAFEWHTFVKGIGFTFLLSGLSIVGSVIVGAIGSFMQRSPSPALRACVGAYVWAFRNTPPLVQLYFFYFALGPSLTQLAGE